MPCYVQILRFTNTYLSVVHLFTQSFFNHLSVTVDIKMVLRCNVQGCDVNTHLLLVSLSSSACPELPLSPVTRPKIIEAQNSIVLQRNRRRSRKKASSAVYSTFSFASDPELAAIMSTAARRRLMRDFKVRMQIYWMISEISRRAMGYSDADSLYSACKQIRPPASLPHPSPTM